VIPAHNEAAVVGRCLDALFTGVAPGEIEVVIVCNGCTDATAEVARRSGHPVTVLELEAPSKIAALRAGERAVRAFPRLYLDADVVVTGATTKALLTRLAQPSVVAARPPICYDASASSWLVQRYYAARTQLPNVMGSMWGAGLYGLSAAGRSRFQDFPPVVAEDLFVDRLFARHEVEILPIAPVTVTCPRTARGLLRVLKRTYRGAAGMAAVPGQPRPGTRATMRELARLALRGLPSLRDAVVYASLVTVGRAAARFAPSHRGTWERDETSRSMPAPAKESSPSAVETRRLFGLDFVCDADFNRTLERILGPQPVDERLPLVVTPNVDQVVRLARPEYAWLAAVLARARIVLPDGQPIVWVSRLLGRPLAARLPGSALFPLVWQRAVAEHRRTLVIAPSVEVAEGLRRQHAELATFVAPIFDAGDEAAVARVVADCLHHIECAQPELVFIGLGFPKQELLALGIVKTLTEAGRPVPLFLLLGGSFDMHLGRVRRAPAWMQHAGLEWLYRLSREPRRLWRRYLVTDMAFIALVWAELRAARRSKRHSDSRT
jgi:exopolysaccharide biosynthesis WecB/TagA/CpsF family protein